MHLSLHSDFACRVLIYLALRPERRTSIEEIAKAYGISQNHLVKIVHRLGKLGFINTVRGRGGGLTLARSAAAIHVGEVVRQMEPSLKIVECFDLTTNVCPIAGACGLKHALARALEAYLVVLDKTTLADIVGNPGRMRAKLGLASS